MLSPEVSDWSSDVCSSDLPKTPKPHSKEKYLDIMAVYNNLIIKMNSFFCKHLLGSFFKIRSSFVIELLFCKSCPTLGLCILNGWLLKSSWCLLHTHHGSWVSSLACPCCIKSCHSSIVSIWISNVHSTFFWYYWVLLSCILVSNNFWLFSNNV
jgi:hypothetical protein